MLYLLILFNGILKLGMIKDGKGWFEVILKLLELINIIILLMFMYYDVINGVIMY